MHYFQYFKYHLDFLRVCHIYYKIPENLQFLLIYSQENCYIQNILFG